MSRCTVFVHFEKKNQNIIIVVINEAVKLNWGCYEKSHFAASSDEALCSLLLDGSAGQLNTECVHTVFLIVNTADGIAE